MERVAHERIEESPEKKDAIYRRRMIRRNHWRSMYYWGREGKREWVDLGSRARLAREGTSMPSESLADVAREDRYWTNQWVKDRFC